MTAWSPLDFWIQRQEKVGSVGPESPMRRLRTRLGASKEVVPRDAGERLAIALVAAFTRLSENQVRLLGLKGPANISPTVPRPQPPREACVWVAPK